MAVTTDKKQPAPGRLELVQAFINTRDLEAGLERLDSASALAGWLRSRGMARARDRVTAAHLERALELRETLRAVVRAGPRNPAPGAGPVLDRVADRARLRVRFEDGGSHRLEPASRGPDGALGEIVAALLDARAEGTLDRLKTCANPGCEWAFYDHTRNRSGTWCEMAVCGNRAKVRAFRDRREKPAGARRGRRVRR